MKAPEKPIPPLPQKIRELGITQAQWEHAHANPLVTTTTELAMALKISPKYLKGEDEKENKSLLKLNLAGGPFSKDLSEIDYGRKFPFIELDLIDPNPFQKLVRTEYDLAEIELVTEQLSESFKNGDLRAFVLNVRKNPANPERFQLVYGHLRLEAARRSGAKVLPAVIDEIDALQMFCQLVKENEQRCAPSIVSLAFQVRFLVEHFNWSYLKISQLYNRSHDMISRLYLLSFASKPFLRFVHDHEEFANVISELVRVGLSQADQEIVLQMLQQPDMTPGAVHKFLKSLMSHPQEQVAILHGKFNLRRKGNEIVEADYIEYQEDVQSEKAFFLEEDKSTQKPVKPFVPTERKLLEISSRPEENGTALAKQTRPL